MADGWIKLHRDIVKKDIYLQDPLYARVFERLIIEANHTCKRIPYKGGTKLIKRGERLTSIRQIAEWVGWYQRGIYKAPNPKTIAKILDWTIEHGLIEIFNKGNSQETHYNIINYCIYQNADDYESNAKVTVGGSLSKQSVDTNNNVKNEKNEKKGIYTTSSSLGEEKTDPLFEEFWESYPRRINKTKALKAWNARRKEKVDPNDLILAARNYATSRQGKDQQYTQHPATFLGPSKPYEDFIKPQEEQRTQNMPRAFASLQEWAKEE